MNIKFLDMSQFRLRSLFDILYIRVKNGNEAVERNIFIFLNIVKMWSCLHEVLFTVQ